MKAILTLTQVFRVLKACAQRPDKGGIVLAIRITRFTLDCARRVGISKPAVNERTVAGRCVVIRAPAATIAHEFVVVVATFAFCTGATGDRALCACAIDFAVHELARAQALGIGRAIPEADVEPGHGFEPGTCLDCWCGGRWCTGCGSVRWHSSGLDCGLASGLACGLDCELASGRGRRPLSRLTSRLVSWLVSWLVS